MTFPSMSVEFNIAAHNYKKIQLTDLESRKNENNIIYWIHCDSNQTDLFQRLTQTLNLPEHVIKLADKEETMPTLIESGDSLTIRVRCLLSNKFETDSPITYGTLVIHLARHYCLTITADDLPAINEFNEGYSKALKYAKTPCFILFLLLDHIINDYSDMLYDVELTVDELDFQIRSDERNPYKEVMDIKKQIMKLKRYMSAIRDILMRISGRKIEVVSEQCRLSLNNLFDHSQMIVAKSDAIREILNGTLDQIDNALMHKLSQSMKVLTAISAAFMPPTLIASIYGMNFHWIPELSWGYGYFYALSLMVLTAVILMVIFKINKWL